MLLIFIELHILNFDSSKDFICI